MLESERQEIINELVVYGLTPVQAQIFVTLLKLKRASAKTISLRSYINRVDVYRALKRLSKLGMIEETLGNPTEYTVIGPDDALEILVAQKLHQVDRLKNLKPALGRKLELLSLYSQNETSGTLTDEASGVLFLKVLSGEQVFRRLKSLLAESRSEIIKVLSPRSMVLYDRIGVPELESLKVKQFQVSVRAVTDINKDNEAQARNYSRAVELRYSSNLASHVRYTIVDRCLLLLPVGEPPENLSDATALWTNSKALINGLVDDFEKLWASSVDAKSRLEELRKKRIPA